MRTLFHVYNGENPYDCNSDCAHSKQNKEAPRGGIRQCDVVLGWPHLMPESINCGSYEKEKDSTRQTSRHNTNKTL